MDKTVTAEFETIDLATFAAKNVTDHLTGVKKVKVSYQKGDAGHNRHGLFSAYLVPFGPYGGTGTPLGMGMDTGMNSGLMPMAVAMETELYEHGSEQHNELDHKRAKVSITAPEGLVQQIESTLHSGGGLSVQVS